VGEVTRKQPEWHEHNVTHEIVCPHCGYEHGDSWEQSSDSGEFECNECEVTFFFERHTDVTYNTSPLTPPEGK
jgi:DNA-directed RNA polymerase subunit RPC12/RpoP